MSTARESIVLALAAARQFWEAGEVEDDKSLSEYLTDSVVLPLLRAEYQASTPTVAPEHLSDTRFCHDCGTDTESPDVETFTVVGWVPEERRNVFVEIFCASCWNGQRRAER